MSIQGDLIGGHTQAMDSTSNNFVQRSDDFKTALTNINSAVIQLMSEWWGQGSSKYQDAMSQWDSDAKRIVADLEQLSRGLGTSSAKFTELDTELTSLFNGFGV